MSVWGITMMRNEADVAFDVVAHMFSEGCEGVLVYDNLSDDGTGKLAEEAGATVLLDDEPGYYQADKMTRLAYAAADNGATWIVPFDADEIWYRGTNETIAQYLEATDADVVKADMWCHYETEGDPLDKGWSPFQWMGHRVKTINEKSLPKVAFRAMPEMRLEMGNHGVYLPGNVVSEIGLTIRHFQYRGLEHFIRKVRIGKAAYDASDLPDGYGAHWRLLGKKSDRELRSEYRRRFMKKPLEMVFDPAPLCAHA